MKKNTTPTDRKKLFAICVLSALCIAVLAGAYFLTREPEREFIPASAERADVTDTWEEKSGTDAILPDAAAQESTQIQGTASDNTQTVISEDETGSTTSLSDSSTKEEALQEKPTEPPVTTDDVTDPDRQPEYDPPVQQAQTPAPSQDNPAGGSGTPSGGTGADGSHPGQVYDPVFGWIDVGNTQQDNIDSDGDINKQIGTMGGN
ncbi:MAG: hypothetical protein K2I96_13340 [Lachnospiraceae bacterium]|nr:hypothetical protein [Lachnospiraceae bacterium]